MPSRLTAVKSRGRNSWCWPKGARPLGTRMVLKGPLKYLVAKLHRCYPGEISLPVCQYFFRALFSALARRRFKSLFNFFTSLQRTQKNTFCLHFYWLMAFFTVTTCVWCVYFLYLSVLLAGKCHPSTDVGYMLSPGQTIATCQRNMLRNMLQHCCDMLRWHVAIVWPGLYTVMLMEKFRQGDSIRFPVRLEI